MEGATSPWNPDPCLVLPLRILAAVFVHGEGGGGRDVVAIGETVDGDLYADIHPLELFFGQAQALVAEDKSGFARERKVMHVLSSSVR